MAVWKWTEKFTDIREYSVEAETLEEAQRKRNDGDWLDETTTEFYSEELLSDIEKVSE